MTSEKGINLMTCFELWDLQENRWKSESLRDVTIDEALVWLKKNQERDLEYWEKNCPEYIDDIKRNYPEGWYILYEKHSPGETAI